MPPAAAVHQDVDESLLGRAIRDEHGQAAQERRILLGGHEGPADERQDEHGHGSEKAGAAIAFGEAQESRCSPAAKTANPRPMASSETGSRSSMRKISVPRSARTISSINSPTTM